MDISVDFGLQLTTELTTPTHFTQLSTLTFPDIALQRELSIA